MAKRRFAGEELLEIFEKAELVSSGHAEQQLSIKSSVGDSQ